MSMNEHQGTLGRRCQGILTSLHFFLAAVALLACAGRESDFDRSLVRATVTSKPELGGQIEVYFVKNATDADLFALARECVHDYRREYKSAACFAFRSDADFTHARIDRSSGGMENLCWRARYFRALVGGEGGEEGNNLSYDGAGCPGGRQASSQGAEAIPAVRPSMQQPLNTPARIDATLERNSEGRVCTRGTTNLPDGMILMVQLDADEERSFGNLEARVVNGTFGPACFRELPAGRYRVVIGSPYAQVQPETIRALIGPNGENLQGTLVVHDSTFGNVVEYEAWLTTDRPLGQDQSSLKKDPMSARLGPARGGGRLHSASGVPSPRNPEERRATTAQERSGNIEAAATGTEDLPTTPRVQPPQLDERTPSTASAAHPKQTARVSSIATLASSGSKYWITAFEVCPGQKPRRALDTKLEPGDRASFEFACPVSIHAAMGRSEQMLGEAGIHLSVDDVPCVGPTRIGVAIWSWALTPNNLHEKCPGLTGENRDQETPR